MIGGSVRLGAVATTRVSNVDKHTVDGEVPVRLCNYTDVYHHEIIRADMSFMTATAKPAQLAAFVLQAGDTVITKDSETADDIGVPAFVSSCASDLVCGYHLAIVRPDASRINPRYLFWSLMSDSVSSQWEVRANGVTRVGLKSSDLKTVQLWLPATLGEQRAIADFLDRETAQIDALIEKQHALIDRLRERRDATWGHLYLSTSAGNSELHLRRVVASIVDGPFGSALTSAHYSDAGVRVIRLGNIGVGEFRDRNAAYIPWTYGRSLATHAAEAGDVVMAGLGDERMPLGRAAVVPEGLGPAIVKADCYRLRPGAKVSGEYLAWSLSSPPVRLQIADRARGATRARLNTSIAKETRIVVPPLDEQRSILEKWRVVDARTGALIAKAQRFIELARERRSALITAAVTGQIDIQNEVE